jgi:exopolyphosphatase / guanosine-5'-triphosphate,3'-diphosphate pyrophosphatase
VTVAVIDLGTLTTRLLLVDSDRRERFQPMTRMGEGLAVDGRISPAALERVRAVLVEHRDRIEAAAPSATRVVATSAARDARNRDELFAIVLDVLGQPVDLLDGHEEGRLAFAGAVAARDPESVAPGELVAVVDIGGGSTEFSVGSGDGRVIGVMSTDMGAGRVTSNYLPSDPPRPEELSAALSVIQLHLDDARRELPALDLAIGSGTVLGVGGTITTVAAVELGLLDLDDRSAIHGFVLEREAVEDVFRTLATESLVDRRHNPGLPPDRAEVIVGGCAVLVGMMRHLAIEQIVVSEHDLLDGVASELV